jgi:hypothetical protein
MFLGAAAAAAPCLGRGPVPKDERLVVDLGRGCVLPESLVGFCAALGVCGTRLSQVRELGQDAAAQLIIPGVGCLAEAGITTIQRHLRRGATVLLECGFGFLEAGEFARNSALLHRRLGLEVVARPSQDDFAYFPYVDYSWPVRVKVREFRPVWFGSIPGDEVIGAFAGRPVALRRKMNDGRLIAMGSPIGPVFLTGDSDARHWLDLFFGTR